MSETSKAVNAFFRTAIRRDIDGLVDDLLLSRRQERIYELFYIKRMDINYIADTIGCCPRIVQKELRTIRKKIVSALGL